MREDQLRGKEWRRNNAPSTKSKLLESVKGIQKSYSAPWLIHAAYFCILIWGGITQFLLGSWSALLRRRCLWCLSVWSSSSARAAPQARLGSWMWNEGEGECTLNKNPAAIWVPKMPSVGESCPGEGSPACVQEQNSGELSACWWWCSSQTCFPKDTCGFCCTKSSLKGFDLVY